MPPRNHTRRRLPPRVEFEDLDPLVALHLLSGKILGIAPMGELRHVWASCRVELLAQWRADGYRGRAPWASEQFDDAPETL